MERKTEVKTTKSGIVFEEETIKTTPEDGFVHEQTIRPAALPTETRGKYHKGYSTTKTFSTNDPRVTRPFAYGMCGLFFVIGLGMLLAHQWFFALSFCGVSVFGFVKAKKDIDRIAQELKKQGRDVTIDSKEELCEVTSEVADIAKTGFQESAKETFTQEHMKRLTKLTLPWYCALGVIMTVVISLVVNVILGMVVLAIFCVGGFLFYGVLMKLLTLIGKS